MEVKVLYWDNPTQNAKEITKYFYEFNKKYNVISINSDIIKYNVIGGGSSHKIMYTVMYEDKCPMPLELIHSSDVVRVKDFKKVLDITLNFSEQEYRIIEGKFSNEALIIKNELGNVFTDLQNPDSDSYRLALYYIKDFIEKTGIVSYEKSIIYYMNPENKYTSFLDNLTKVFDDEDLVLAAIIVYLNIGNIVAYSKYSTL